MHGCNAQGVMGSGVAKAIRDAWPVVFEEYKKEYNKNGLEVGKNYYVEVDDSLTIVNAITQEFYGKEPKRYAEYSSVKLCLQEAACLYKRIAIPQIACGLGGLEWPVIKSIIKTVELQTGSEFIVYTPPKKVP